MNNATATNQVKFSVFTYNYAEEFKNELGGWEFADAKFIEKTFDSAIQATMYFNKQAEKMQAERNRIEGSKIDYIALDKVRVTGDNEKQLLEGLKYID